MSGRGRRFHSTVSTCTFLISDFDAKYCWSCVCVCAGMRHSGGRWRRPSCCRSASLKLFLMIPVRHTPMFFSCLIDEIHDLGVSDCRLTSVCTPPPINHCKSYRFAAHDISQLCDNTIVKIWFTGTFDLTCHDNMTKSCKQSMSDALMFSPLYESCRDSWAPLTQITYMMLRVPYLVPLTFKQIIYFVEVTMSPWTMTPPDGFVHSHDVRYGYLLIYARCITTHSNTPILRSPMVLIFLARSCRFSASRFFDFNKHPCDRNAFSKT